MAVFTRDVALYDYDVVVLTETCLCYGTNDTETPSFVSNLLQDNTIEQLYITFLIGFFIFLVGPVYIPLYPNNNVSDTHTNIVNNKLTQNSNSKIKFVQIIQFLYLRVFNLSMSTGCFPNFWKSSFITQILKHDHHPSKFEL